MQPLDSLFTPLTARVNRTLAETTPARAIASELDGKSFAIRVRQSALAMCLSVQDGRLETSAELPDEPDVIVEGSLSGLVRMAFAGDDMAALSESGVTVSGRPDLAQKFQRLLKLARPDPEEELARVVGDAAAHEIGAAVKETTNWGERTARIVLANIREFLQEERRDVPSPYEMSRFRSDVDTLRDDVERAEARLKAIEARRT